jgi:DNA-binding transcriptional LysR family regulator
MPILTTAARCFVEAALAGSIRKAADRLNISASAVNRQILNLESELGLSLFERLPRGIKTTPGGAILLRELRRWQDGVHALARDLHALSSHNEVLAIGLMECLADDFFPEWLSELRAGCVAETIVGGTREIVGLLIDGKVDVIIAFNVEPTSEFRIVYSVAVPIGAVVNPGHRFAGRNAVTLADCAGEKILRTDYSLTLRPVTDVLLRPGQSQTDTVGVSNSIAMIKAAIRRGTGISLLTTIDVAAELRSRTLAFVPLNDARATETLSLCVRDLKNMSDTKTILIDRLARDLNRYVAQAQLA